MILQALTDYYKCQLKKGDMPLPGYANVKVSYALQIGENGDLEEVIDLKEKGRGRNKETLVPQNFCLPARVERSSNISSNFICDNSSYILGIDNKKDASRAVKCFEKCKAFHLKLLEGTNSPAAEALCAFFRKWDPEKASEHPALREYLNDLIGGGNLLFRYDGYIHDDERIKAIWDKHYRSSSPEKPETVCLVTGEKISAEAVHPLVKGVRGAQGTGAALVSFNAPAFCSYGKEQSLNAPVGKYAAFAYTTALNNLLSDKKHVGYAGDTTIVYWAKNGESPYQDCMRSCLFGDTDDDDYDEKDILGVINSLIHGEPVEFNKENLDPGMEFFILGLSPNVSRLSVRFFLHNSFGGFLGNIKAHYDRMEIVKPSDAKFEYVPIRRVLRETVNQKSKDKEPVPNLAGEVLRAVLTNTRYPAALINGVRLRILAEREINRERAAIIKAYYLKNTHHDVPEEVLKVKLNSNSANVPYTLGRLFRVLETVQERAVQKTTIKDKYFVSASSMPALTFPTLINLAQKHLKKLGDRRGYYENQITQLIGKLGETYPSHLSLPEQGAFQLGYYHQSQKQYKKEEK